MPNEVMIKGDWWREVKAAAKPKSFDWEAQTLEVAVEFPKELHAKLGKDPLLLQKLSDGGSTAYKAFIKDCVGHVEWAEALLLKAHNNFDKNHDPAAFMEESDRINKGFIALMSKSAKAAPASIEKSIMDAWAKLQKTQKDYRDYKVRAAAKIGLKLAAISISVAVLVGSQGTNPFAWRGLVTDSIKTIDELVTLAKDAESMRKRAESTLNRVIAWHKAVGDGKGAATSEVGLGLLKIALGTDVRTTFDAANSDVKAYQSKLGGLDAKAHDAAKKLQKLLPDLGKSMDAATPQIAAEVKALQKEVAKLIELVVSLQEEIKSGEVWAGNIGKLLAEMVKAKNLSELARCLKGVETATEVAFAINTWVKFSGDAAKLALYITKDLVTVGKNIERWMDEVKKLRR